MSSYTSERRGLAQFIREARHLVADVGGDIPLQVSVILERLHEIEHLSEEKLALRLEGRKMLDVGAGQMMLQMAYFSAKNDVHGVDFDVIASGIDVTAYLRMLRMNGAKRVVKTVGRKSLMIDARYRRELARQMGVSGFPPLRVKQMDVSSLTFPDASFDFVYSLATFQHLSDPGQALERMTRVLAPGGGLYLDFVLYTSRTGSHDVRFFTGDDEDLPLWPQLRPRYEGLVHPNAYLNRLRLPEWNRIFEETMPGFESVLYQPEAAQLEPEAKKLQEQDELTDYSLEELLTSKVAVLWRKPAV